MCDHFQCEHLGNKPNIRKLETDLKMLLARNIATPIPQLQVMVDALLVQCGLPTGSIILVDDTPKFPKLTPEMIEQLQPRMLSPTFFDGLVTEPVFIPHQPGELDVRNWSFDYLDTDCGYACTPDGCRGHETDIPIALNIGQVILTFPDAEYAEQTKQICEVARYIEGLIKADQERRAAAERVAGQIEYGTIDGSAKTIVRGREELLRHIEKGYRLFSQSPNVQFLRASGMPDLLYYND